MALTKVLDKARIVASFSTAQIRRNNTKQLVLAKGLPEDGKIVERRRFSVLKPNLGEQELRKVRSVKSRVRFTNDEEPHEMVRDESSVSIGETIAMQEY
jgi:hypothetical protein